VANAEVTLERPRVFVGLASGDEPQGDWLVEGHDSNGFVLFRHRTTLRRWDHADQARPLAATIPISTSAEASLSTVVVRGPRGERASIRVRAGAP
jgi:hypothetical protein